MIAALSLCAVLFVVRMAAKPVALVSPRLDRAVRQGLFQFCARSVLSITGLRLTVHGARPKPPFFLVTNHLTFMDVFVLASELGCVFVSRADLAQWPFIGHMTRHMNTIFIDRESWRDTVRVNEQILTTMQQGYGVAVFAESRVSQQGDVQPFKPALLQPAVQLGLPVHYASVSYQTPEGSPPAKEIAIWKHDVGFFRHYLNVAAMPHYACTLTFGDEPKQGTDRKALANALYEAVRDQFTPLN